jgi:hypothetical protein
MSRIKEGFLFVVNIPRKKISGAENSRLHDVWAGRAGQVKGKASERIQVKNCL